MLSNQTLVFNKLVGITATLATVGLTLATVSPAQALTLSVDGTIDSGDLLDTTYTGTFSFDDPVPNFTGTIPVSPLSITFTDTEVPPNTATFTEADMPAPGPMVEYLDGDLLGLEFSVVDAELGTVTFDFSFVPGFTEVGEASLFYDIEGGGSGTGSAEFAVVPEPTTMLASFGILGVLGCYRRRSNN